jgi:outer membrane protein TolC
MMTPPPAARHNLKTWQEALRLVRTQSTSLELSRARVELAAGQARQALSQALPTLTGFGNLNHHLLLGEGPNFNTLPITTTSVPDPATTWNMGLSLRVPVFAPKAWHDHGTAKDRIDAARLSTKDTERLILAAVADSIVSVITAERLTQVTRVSLETALSTLNLNRRRAQLGASSAVDVLRAEQEVARSRALVISADEGLRRAREALGVALGSNVPWSVPSDLSFDQLARDAQTSCHVVPDVKDRADVKVAQAETQIAERQVDSADWLFWPTLDALSNLTYYSNEFTANRERITWTIGAALTWPLYDGGLRYGIRDASQAELRLARAQLSETKRQALYQVAQATRAVQVADANFQVAQKARDIAKESARLSRIAFINGSGTSFDLVDTESTLRSAELDVAIKEFELVRAKIAAFLALAACDV